jgi:hypothetical protein
MRGSLSDSGRKPAKFGHGIGPSWLPYEIRRLKWHGILQYNVFVLVIKGGNSYVPLMAERGNVLLTLFLLS